MMKCIAVIKIPWISLSNSNTDAHNSSLCYGHQHKNLLSNVYYVMRFYDHHKFLSSVISSIIISPGVNGHHIPPSDLSMKATIMVSIISSQDVAGNFTISSAPVTVFFCTSKNFLYTIKISSTSISIPSRDVSVSSTPTRIY